MHAAKVPVCFNTLFDLLLLHSDGFNFYETLWCAVLLVVALNKRTFSRETLNKQQNSVSLFASTKSRDRFQWISRDSQSFPGFLVLVDFQIFPVNFFFN